MSNIEKTVRARLEAYALEYSHDVEGGYTAQEIAQDILATNLDVKDPFMRIGSEVLETLRLDDKIPEPQIRMFVRKIAKEK